MNYDKSKALPLMVTLDDALDVGHTKWGNNDGFLCIACDAEDELLTKLILRTGLATHDFRITEAVYLEYPHDEDDPESDWVYTSHFTTDMTICRYNAISYDDPKQGLTCTCASCKAVAH